MTAARAITVQVVMGQVIMQSRRVGRGGELARWMSASLIAR
jgi:hypothetical protein